MSTLPDPDRQEQTSPWAKPGFVLSALVIVLILVLGLALLFIDPFNPSGPSAAPASSAPPAPAAGPGPAGAPDESVCGLPAGSQTVPRTNPAAGQWELVGRMAVPSAPDVYGPGRVEGGLRTCYAHSPVGALYAAVNITAMTAVPELRVPLIRSLSVPGPGQVAALEAARADQAGSATGGVQLAGFTFLNYDPAGAVIDLAVRAVGSAGQSGYVHIPMTLRWQDGDWKVVLGPDGSLGTGIGPIPNLTGYIPWSGA